MMRCVGIYKIMKLRAVIIYLVDKLTKHMSLSSGSYVSYVGHCVKVFCQSN